MKYFIIAYPLAALFSAMLLIMLAGCQQPATEADRVSFIEQKDAGYKGDYLATYPLASPDSCIARLKAEVPAPYQPWCAMSLWYHLPRTSKTVSFRMLDLYEENYPHDTVTAFCLIKRAEWYVDLAQYDSARTCLDAAYDLYMDLGRPLDATDATFLRARSYLYQSNTPAAIQAYLQMLAILNANDTTFSERHALLYADIAVAYERSNNRAKELEWLLKAWNTDHSKLGNPIGYKASLSIKCANYYLRSNPDSSLYWAKQAISFSKQNTQANIITPARLEYTLARAHFKKGNCDTALVHFQSAHRQANPKAPLTYYQICRSLGECFLCTGQPDSARHYLQLALASPDTINLAEANKVLAQAYAQSGDWKRAYEAAQQGRLLYEASVGIEKAKAVEVLTAQFETANKEQLLIGERAKRAAEQQQKWIALLVALLVLGLGGAFYLRQRSQRIILEQDHELLQQEKALIETQAQLQAQELEHSKEALEKSNRLLSIKNRIIEELHVRLNDGQDEPMEPTVIADAISLQSFRSIKILTKENWKQFKLLFEQAFPNYIDRLQAAHPTLTNAEIRLILLIKLDFSYKEIAETLGISEDSVLRGRRRLAQKLGLPDSRHLLAFAEQVSSVSGQYE